MTDLERLQGAWRQTRVDADGRSNVTDEYGANVTTVFAGHRFTVYAVGGGVVLAGELVIDESTDPRSIDWIDAIGADAGKSLPAIYRLDGDGEYFSFVAADAGAPRPSAFHAGAGQVLRSFVRVRP